MTTIDESDQNGLRLISNRDIVLSLDGYLMPADPDGQPILLRLAARGSSDVYLPMFSTHAKMVAAMALPFMPEFARVKQVTDGGGFMQSIEQSHARGAERGVRLHVIADLYLHDNGNLRFTEVFIVEGN